MTLEQVEVCEENAAQLRRVAALIGLGLPSVVAELIRKLEGSGAARVMWLSREECALIEAAQRLLNC